MKTGNDEKGTGNLGLGPTRLRPAANVLGRVALILLAALLVAGAVYAAVNNGLADSLGGERERHGEFDGAAFESEAGERFAGRLERGEGHHEEGGGFSLRNLGEVLKNLAAIGLIVLGVGLVSRAGSRAQRWRKEKAPPADAF